MAELTDITLPLSAGVTAPVLIVNGTKDAIFCAGTLGVSCATPSAIADAERPYFRTRRA